MSEKRKKKGTRTKKTDPTTAGARNLLDGLFSFLQYISIRREREK
jgi:hypothetical protein